MNRARSVPGPIVMAVSYLVGAIPISGIFARRLRSVDLRDVGSGTVSGTGLYRVAGWQPLFVAGVLDVAKGTVGPLLAGPHRPLLRSLAAGAAVAGHNWSPYLKGAGGRGIAPALGSLLVVAPEGTALMLAGLAIGKFLGATAVGGLVADLTLVPVLARTRGIDGAGVAAAVVVPMLVKRVVGNGTLPPGSGLGGYRYRLVHDLDPPPRPLVAHAVDVE